MSITDEGQNGHVTYITNARTALLDQLGDEAADWDTEQRLLDLYTLLVLVKGERVTLADVHDAWAVARTRTRPDHRDLIPFGSLDPDTQDYDEPYRSAIAAAANAIGPTVDVGDPR